MSSRKNTLVAVASTALALIVILVAGCSLDRWAGVESGEYAVTHGGQATDMAAARQIHSLVIDRDTDVMVLALVDGSEIITSFLPRDRAEWPSGCPSNINSTRMEVLEIAERPLTLGATTFNHPVLVRDCPPDPVRLVLREDGEISGGGTACPYPEPCIFFAP